MKKINKTIGAGLLAAATAFGGAAGADDVPGPATAPDYDGWYEALRPLSFLKGDPESRCAPAARPDAAHNDNQAAQAHNLLAAMDRAPMAQLARDAFVAADGALCFLDFSQEFGASVTAFAMHFSSYNAILINSAPGVAEGCIVAAGIHEMHHSAQAARGYGITPHLTRAAQEDMVFGIEADAHAIQLLGAWQMAQAGYAEAHRCNVEEFGKMPHFAEGLAAMEASLSADPASFDDGRAASATYDAFLNSYSLFRHYAWALGDMYGCQYNPECFRERHTLEDIGVDMAQLGRIHYPQGGYETTLFSPIRESVVAKRNQPQP